jgi:small-conductance mechanosensitive channel
MQIKEITVDAGRTFNHPYEQYSNLRPSVRLVATIDSEEDPVAATKALQAQAERLVEDHKTALLPSLENIAELDRAAQTIAQLDRQISEAQGRLDRARKYVAERQGQGTGLLPAAPKAQEARSP